MNEYMICLHTHEDSVQHQKMYAAPETILRFLLNYANYYQKIIITDTTGELFAMSENGILTQYNPQIMQVYANLFVQ